MCTLLQRAIFTNEAIFLDSWCIIPHETPMGPHNDTIFISTGVIRLMKVPVGVIAHWKVDRRRIISSNLSMIGRPLPHKCVPGLAPSAHPQIDSISWWVVAALKSIVVWNQPNQHHNKAPCTSLANFTARRYASAVYAVVVCLSVCLSVSLCVYVCLCVCVRHMPVS